MTTHVHVYRVIAFKEYDFESDLTKEGYEEALRNVLKDAKENYSLSSGWVFDAVVKFIAVVPADDDVKVG